MKTINQLHTEIYNHPGFAIAKKSYLNQVKFETESVLTEAMAETYAMMMVITKGDVNKSVEFVLSNFEVNKLKQTIKAIS